MWVAVDPGHGDFVGILTGRKQHYAWPISDALAQTGVHGVGDDVDEAVEQGLVVQDWLG
jgi:hypothetical protein